MIATTETTHWIHERFVQNLVNASGSTSLAECARHWEAEAFAKSESVLQCNVCNTKLFNYVVLQNTVNGNRLLIGEDCYSKLLHFLECGRVESTLPSMDYLREVRKYSRALLNRTVLGWFAEQKDAGTLPENLVRILESIKLHGWAQSKEDADSLVEFYKKTRQFKTTELIPGSKPYKELLPEIIVINDADRVSSLLNRFRSGEPVSARAIGMHYQQSYSYPHDYPHFILTVEIEGVRHDVWTERNFRQALGTRRLMEPMRDEIELRMPSQVEVIAEIGRRGTPYFTLTNKTVEAWMS